MTEVGVAVHRHASVPKVPHGIGQLVHNCQGLLLDHSQVYCPRFPRNTIQLYHDALDGSEGFQPMPGLCIQFDFGYLPQSDTFLAVNVRPLAQEPLQSVPYDNRYWFSVMLTRTTFGGFYKHELLGLVADPRDVLTPYSLCAHPPAFIAFVEYAGKDSGPAKFHVANSTFAPSFECSLRSVGFVLDECVSGRRVYVAELAHLEVRLSPHLEFEVGQWINIHTFQWTGCNTVQILEAAPAPFLGKLDNVRLEDGNFAFRSCLKSYAAQEKLIFNEDIGLVMNATATELGQRYTYMWVVENPARPNGVRLRAIATNRSELTSAMQFNSAHRL